MKLTSAAELLEELNTLDEHPGIEAKTSQKKLSQSVIETLCAFANEPNLNGGYLLLGVSQSPQDGTYRVVGVENPDKIQSEIATLCGSIFNRVLRPQILVDRLDGKTVLVIYLAESAHHNKPIYIKSRGLPSGAFRRI